MRQMKLSQTQLNKGNHMKGGATGVSHCVKAYSLFCTFNQIKM